MKTPLVDKCPCCKAATPDAIPSSDYPTRGVGMELIDSILFWTCKRCGCEWRHGQYDYEEQLHERVDLIGVRNMLCRLKQEIGVCVDCGNASPANLETIYSMAKRTLALTE